MTIAEAVNNAIQANREDDTWEIMEQVSNFLFDQHRTMNDEGDIVGFTDGSFYSFDPNFIDGNGNKFFASRAELMESIDGYNSALDYMDSRSDVVEYVGTVCESGDRIDTLKLTDIVDASGNQVEFVPTERYAEAEDNCDIEYRTHLAEAIGKSVRITAREDSYNADGSSAKGFPFSYKEPVLLDVTLLVVLPTPMPSQGVDEALATELTDAQFAAELAQRPSVKGQPFIDMKTGEVWHSMMYPEDDNPAFEQASDAAEAEEANDKQV